MAAARSPRDPYYHPPQGGRGPNDPDDPSRPDLPAGLGHSGGGGPAPNRLNLLLTAPEWRRDSWADRLPSLLNPMGIQSLWARSARQAEQVIRTSPIHIAVVDLTLPLEDCTSHSGCGPAGDASRPTPAEEGGTRILDILARMPSPPPTVVIQSSRGHRDSARCMSAALRCGAFSVIDWSAADIELILDVMRRAVNRFYGSRWPGAQQANQPSAPAPRRLYEDPRNPGIV